MEKQGEQNSKPVVVEPFWRVIYNDDTYMDKYEFGKENKWTAIDQSKVKRLDILVLSGERKIGPIIQIPFYPDCMELILRYDIEIYKNLGEDGKIEDAGKMRKLLFGTRINEIYQQVWSLSQTGVLKTEPDVDFDNIPK